VTLGNVALLSAILRSVGHLFVEALQAPNGVGNGEGVSPPEPIKGSKERCKLPRGVGAESRRKINLVHF